MLSRGEGQRWTTATPLHLDCQAMQGGPVWEPMPCHCSAFCKQGIKGPHRQASRSASEAPPCRATHSLYLWQVKWRQHAASCGCGDMHASPSSSQHKLDAENATSTACIPTQRTLKSHHVMQAHPAADPSSSHTASTNAPLHQFVLRATKPCRNTRQQSHPATTSKRPCHSPLHQFVLERHHIHADPAKSRPHNLHVACSSPLH